MGDTLEVARGLLGAHVCYVEKTGALVRVLLTEVEAYDGEADLACHASKGKTERTRILFGPAGRWYLYLCYGVHWLANVVVGEEGYPAAVLLRGTGDVMGPGRLTRSIGMTGAINGAKIERASGYWLERGVPVPESEVGYYPRVGVDYAGEKWAKAPYRMIWKTRWSGTLAEKRRLFGS